MFTTELRFPTSRCASTINKYGFELPEKYKQGESDRTVSIMFYLGTGMPHQAQEMAFNIDTYLKHVET